MTQNGGKRWAKEKGNEMTRWLFLKPIIIATVIADKCLEGDRSQNDLGRMQDEAGINGRKSAFKLVSSFQLGFLFIVVQIQLLAFSPQKSPKPQL